MMILAPHHDGSELYVSNSSPRVGERVTLKVRVPKNELVDEIYLRIMQDGEPNHFPLTKSRAIRSESWWSVTVEVVNELTNYRFLLRHQESFRWLNAKGTFDRDVVDHFDFKLVAVEPPPPWLKTAVFYQIFPDRFASGIENKALPKWAVKREWNDIPATIKHETSEEFFGGDLVGVIKKLDYIADLGVSGIYFTPFFPSMSNHRYDASSFDEVDPLLGGNSSLIELRNAADKRGIRIMGDLTTNHCGLGHAWIQRAISDKNSLERDFFYWSKKSKWGYVGWWNVKSLPKLNYASRHLKERMYESANSIVKKWLMEPFGMAGWRIDVGNMTGRYFQSNHNREVAKGIRKAMQEVAPDSWLVAENADFFADDLDGLGWHGTMNYSGFTRPIWHWINVGNTKIKDSFGMPGTLPQIGGVAMKEMMQEFSAGIPWRSLNASMILLGSHDRARFHSVVDKDLDRHISGITLLMTYPGVPSVYAGDEVGLEGYWGENGRRTIDWENPQSWNTELKNSYRELIKLRRVSKALAVGGLRWIHADNNSVAYLRESKDESILVFVSNSGVTVDLDLSHFGYSIDKTLFGMKFNGSKIAIKSDRATSSVWKLK